MRTEEKKQRREQEKKSRLSADQMVSLAKVMAPANSKVVTEAIGANLIARVKELTESGRRAVEAQLEAALAGYGRKDRLKRAVGAQTHLSGPKSVGSSWFFKFFMDFKWIWVKFVVEKGLASRDRRPGEEQQPEPESEQEAWRPIELQKML